MEDVFSEELGIHIGIVNIYGPCHNHVAFWEDVMGSSFMQGDNIILGGDLNFSMGHA